MAAESPATNWALVISWISLVITIWREIYQHQRWKQQREGDKARQAQMDAISAQERHWQRQMQLREIWGPIFEAHRGLATWKGKTIEAFHDGLEERSILSLMEKIWVPYQKNPVETEEKILAVVRLELEKARVLQAAGKPVPASNYLAPAPQ